MKKFKLIKVKSIKKFNYSGLVYDITVKNSHSFASNGIFLHNSICKTRIQSSAGMPLLQTLLDCYTKKLERKNI